jgi:hypothetical protein
MESTGRRVSKLLSLYSHEVIQSYLQLYTMSTKISSKTSWVYRTAWQSCLPLFVRLTDEEQKEQVVIAQVFGVDVSDHVL